MRQFGIPTVALWLTLTGLVPFTVPAGLLWILRGDLVLSGQAALALLVYSALILSFLGGVRWGAEINAQGSGGIPRAPILALSVLGALAGWALVLIGVLTGFFWPALAMAAIAHILQGYWDADGAGLPGWFRRLRIIAATGAVLSLAAAAASYAAR